MAEVLVDGLFVCSDCAAILANATLGEEDHEADKAHAEAMQAHQRDEGYLVLGDDHEDFSSRTCDGCGSTLHGYRHEAAIIGTPPECLDGPGECEGAVEYRMPLSGTGKSFPRCDKHWSERLDLDAGLRERYPEQPPSDWSPYDAGESWDED